MKPSPFFRVAFAVVAALGPVAACATGDPAVPALVAVDAASPTSAPPGAQLVQARGCPQCHQPSDSKYGALSGQTVPRPGTHAYGRNLTPDRETGIGAWSDELVLRAIRVGIDDQGDPLCTAMPDFSDIDDVEGAAIVDYLRSLPPVRREIPASRCERPERDAGRDGATPALPEAGGDGGPPAGDGGDGGPPAGDGGDGSTASSESGADACAMLAPGVPGPCHGCSAAASCRANGCYGGNWCDPGTRTCHHRPQGCL